MTASPVQKRLTFTVEGSKHYEVVKNVTSLLDPLVSIVCEYFLSSAYLKLLDTKTLIAHQVVLPGDRVRLLKQQEGEVYFISTTNGKQSLLILDLLTGGKLTQLEYQSCGRDHLFPGVQNATIARNGETIYGLVLGTNPHSNAGYWGICLLLNRWRIQGNQLTFLNTEVVGHQVKKDSHLVLDFDSELSVLIFGTDRKISFAYEKYCNGESVYGTQSVLSSNVDLVGYSIKSHGLTASWVDQRLTQIKTFGEFELMLADFLSEDEQNVSKYPYSSDWIPFINKKVFPPNVTACQGCFWGFRFSPQNPFMEVWNMFRGGTLVLAHYDADNTPLTTLTSNERTYGTVGPVFPSASGLLFAIDQDDNKGITFYYLAL